MLDVHGALHPAARVMGSTGPFQAKTMNVIGPGALADVRPPDKETKMVDSCCGPLADDCESVRTRVVYWHILEAFPNLGRAPTIQDIERDLFFQREQVIDILDALAARGALRVEPASHMILDAYPYSGVPTRHRVVFDNGTSLYCMCAVDTFYVPFLTQRDLTIHSHCFYCRRPIEIRTEGCAIVRAEPSDCVVWNSASSYDCPMTNFFCAEEHLLKWREDAPDEQGRILTLGEALSAGERAVERMRQSRAGLQEIQWAGASSCAIVARCPRRQLWRPFAEGRQVHRRLRTKRRRAPDVGVRI